MLIFCSSLKAWITDPDPRNNRALRELIDVHGVELRKLPNDVIAENVKKLEKRYPGGSFDPYYSENRQEGDI